jgi:hypothetical protein
MKRIFFCFLFGMLFASLGYAATPATSVDQIEYHAREAMANGNYQRVISLLKPQAKQGNAAVQEYMALAYFRLGNKKEGLYWLNKAASSGREQAVFDLSQVYALGIGGVQKNLEKASSLLRPIAEKGDIAAQAQYGAFLAAQEKYAKALPWIKKSIYLPQSMYNMGLYYETGRAGVPINNSKAFDYFLQAANLGHPVALLRVGEYYARGLHGVKKSPEKAYVYLKLAAMMGVADAQYDFKVLTQHNMTPTQLKKAQNNFISFAKNKVNFLSKPEAKKLLDQFAKNADKATPLEQSDLGVMYLMVGNKEAGFKWLRQGAQSNDPRTWTNLATALFATGATNSQQQKEAFDYYLKAANQGEIEAQNNMGSLYASKGDYDTAEKWFLKSIEFPLSKYNLGFMYLKGQGVQADYPKALHYLKQAAAEGCAPALNRLGDMYAHGTHVQKDLAQSYVYLKLAASLGNEEAKNNFKVLTKTMMTKQQIAAGEDDFYNYVGKHHNTIVNNLHFDRYAPIPRA